MSSIEQPAAARTPFQVRWRTRIPSLGVFAAQVRQDPRRFAYDLLPVFSKPGERDLIARALALFRPRSARFSPCDAARAFDRDLRGAGLTAVQPAIAPGIVADLRRHFEAEPCHDPFRPHLGRFRFDAVPSPDTNMGYFTIEQILAGPHVLDLFNAPVILETAELFLGAKPLLDNITAWWSFGGRPAARGTQRFHRDLDSFRGFKVFFYLTDVGPDGGPHVFVKGSQASALLDTGKAQTDSDIAAAFGADRIVSIEGPAGSWFMADTYAFHKGTVPGRGNRLLLTAQYNVNRSVHAPPRPILPAQPGRDPFVNRLYLKG